MQSELDDLPKRRLARSDEQAEQDWLWAQLHELEAMPKTPARADDDRPHDGMVWLDFE